MDFMIFIICVICIMIAFFIIYEISIGRLEERHNAVVRRLAELEEKEIQNKMIREEFHIMKKYFKKFHPDAFKK